MTAEVWRPVKGAPGFEVSNRGGLRRTVQVRPHLAGRGYPTVYINGKKRAIHRLVCEAFNGPEPFEGAVVRHLNDIRDDNRSSNLAWGTMSDNIKDCVRNGTHRGNRRLTADDVRDIRRRFVPAFARNGAGNVRTNAKELAEEFGVTPTNILYITKRRSWKDVV